MLEKYYTPEQLDTLEQRRKELGDEAQEQYHRDWDELIATARRAVAAKWRELIELFTGGDEALLGSLKTMFQEEGPERASQGQIDAGLMEYVGQAIRLQLQALGEVGPARIGDGGVREHVDERRLA